MSSDRYALAGPLSMARYLEEAIASGKDAKTIENLRRVLEEQKALIKENHAYLGYDDFIRKSSAYGFVAALELGMLDSTIYGPQPDDHDPIIPIGSGGMGQAIWQDVTPDTHGKKKTDPWRQWFIKVSEVAKICPEHLLPGIYLAAVYVEEYGTTDELLWKHYNALARVAMLCARRSGDRRLLRQVCKIIIDEYTRPITDEEFAERDAKVPAAEVLAFMGHCTEVGIARWL